MIIDFKAHVMPGMDKTCKNRIDTIRRLMAAKDAGVDLIVAAPVYDPDECSVEEFLDRRRQSEDILGSLMNDELPEVMTAAMVKFSDKLQQLGVHVMLDLEEIHHKKQIRAYLPLIGSGLICAIGSDWGSEAPYRFLRKTKRRMDEAFDTVMAASAHLLGR